MEEHLKSLACFEKLHIILNGRLASNIYKISVTKCLLVQSLIHTNGMIVNHIVIFQAYYYYLWKLCVTKNDAEAERNHQFERSAGTIMSDWGIIIHKSNDL